MLIASIVDSGYVYDPAQMGHAPGQVACFPSGICQMASGTLLSVCQVGDVKNDISSTLVISSFRDGQRWEPYSPVFPTTFEGVPGSLSNGELVETSPGRLLLLSTWLDRSDPSRPFYDPQTEGLIHTRLLKAFSDDEGNSWTPWQAVDVVNCPYAIHGSGPLIHLPDGQIGCVIETHKAFDDAGTDEQTEGTWLILSRDGGNSFSAPALIAQDPLQQLYFWDIRCCVTQDSGAIISLFWTHDRQNKTDRTVHVAKSRITESFVRAGSVRATNIHGQISAPLVWNNTLLLAAVVHREQPGTIALWWSQDEIHWEKLIDVYQHLGDRSTVRMSDIEIVEIWENIAKWGFGHPSIFALDNTRLLVTYYAGLPAHMSIRWTIVHINATSTHANN